MGALLEIFSEENQTAQKQLHINSQSRILVISTEGATDPNSYQSIVG